jgi:very-short-patch-repair endonuclease
MDGMAAVRKQLRTCCPRTLSEPERVVARALKARHFTMEINARVGRFYGDLVDFSARVIVEIDGREFHTDPATFNNDRRRQNELVLDGWLVLRYSAATALAELDRVVDEIITVVRRRRKSIAAKGRRLPCIRGIDGQGCALPTPIDGMPSIGGRSVQWCPQCRLCRSDPSGQDQSEARICVGPQMVDVEARHLQFTGNAVRPELRGDLGT